MPGRIFGFGFTFVLACWSMMPGVYLRAHERTPCPAESRLMLHAALVLTSEFCATKLKKGIHGLNHETFDVGKAVCAELEPRLKNVFSNLVRVEQPSAAANAQVILIPKFLDNQATQTAFAFAKRELVINVEWTAEDQSDKVIWVEAVQGSAKRAPGNVFTHGVQLKRIVRDSVEDLAEQSANKMLTSPALRKLGNTTCGSGM